MLKTIRFSELLRLYHTYKHYAWKLGLPLAAGLQPVPVRAQTVSYAAPIVITQGGTYTGNYQSLSSGTPCVRIATTAAVVLDGCNLSGAGNLIEGGTGTNLTVRNCRGQGLTPTVDNQAPGRFLDAYQAQHLVIEHNVFTQTSGIVINRWSGTSQTLTVRYNQARNIDGRWRNVGGSTRSSFLLLNTVPHLTGAEIAYNEVINTADQSLVEDNINLYNSSGTAASPLRVHDNFVRGAYPFPATATSFTGSGLTTDGDDATVAGAASYIEADHNQFVGTGNAAMNLAAGHDVYYHDNRAVTAGTLPDGRRFAAGWAGFGVFNYYNQPAGVYGNNRVENNTVGYVRWGGTAPFIDRQDLSPGACAPCTGTVSLPNPITTATEDAEWTSWQQKLLQAGITIGISVSTTTSGPATTGTVINPGFEADGAAVGAPMGWQTRTGTGTNDNADYTEAYPGAHTGTYHGTHYRPEAYQVYTYQTITSLTNGTYSLQAWVKSGGGQTLAQLRASGYGGNLAATAIPGTTNGQWTQISITGLAVTTGSCEIGFYSQAVGGQWLYFDDVELVRQNTPPTVALATTASLTLGQPLVLSATAADTDGTISKVEFFNGTTKLGESATVPYQLTWSPTAIGVYSLTARATDNAGATTTSAAVTATVIAPAVIVPTTTAGTNLAINPGFELDGVAVGAPTGWLTQTGTGTSDNADYTETYPGAHTGLFHGTHYRPDAYNVYTYQLISNLPTGTYTVRAWVKSGGTQAQLRAKNYGGAALTTAVPASSSAWVQVEITNIAVTNGQCEIGFYSAAQSGQWFYFDDVTFVAQPAASTNTVLNSSFDDDQTATQSPSRWTTQIWGTTQAYASYTEAYPGAHTGTYHGTHYRPEAYQVYTHQTVTSLTNGTYSLRAWVKSSGGQTLVQLRASGYGSALATMAITATNNQWVQVTLPGLMITTGQCDIGVYSQANGGQWLYFDDVELMPDAPNTTPATTIVGPSLYPNPADNEVTITADFAQADNLVFIIINSLGLPETRHWRTAVPGTNRFVINTTYLSNGFYTIQTQSNQNQALPMMRLQVTH